MYEKCVHHILLWNDRNGASVLYSVSNHVAGVPGMLACLQEYHMCGENQAVKYRPFASIHVLY